MKLPRTNCPNCNALELLTPHKRKVGDLTQVYTRCRTCRSEFILDTFSEPERKQRDKVSRERRRQIRTKYRFRNSGRS